MSPTAKRFFRDPGKDVKPCQEYREQKCAVFKPPGLNKFGLAVDSRPLLLRGRVRNTQVTWTWEQVHPQGAELIAARDFASAVAVDEKRILLYGGHTGSKVRWAGRHFRLGQP